MEGRLARALLVPLSLALFSANAAAETMADDIVGVWATEEEEAHVEIYQRAGRFYGRFVGFENEPRDGGLDEKNPDPALRDRALLGTDFILDFEFDGKKWKKGRIYNPEDGKRYEADLELKEGNLRVRGWIGIRLLGRTVTWTRVR